MRRFLIVGWSTLVAVVIGCCVALAVVGFAPTERERSEQDLWETLDGINDFEVVQFSGDSRGLGAVVESGEVGVPPTFQLSETLIGMTVFRGPDPLSSSHDCTISIGHWSTETMGRDDWTVVGIDCRLDHQAVTAPPSEGAG